ncbi:MAG: family 10 glycosylhydrolase [Muribaculaceae bacterium]|nr:family 10 glycosylhydrolase [Muribaculaceae bacterium]
MKKFLLIILVAIVTLTTMAQVKREHRAVWMSAYVNDWPAGAITSSNARTMQNACCKMLDTLRNNNMNAVYYHVRAMCDAMYNSAYEPWSSDVSGTRGVAPPFDPFEFLLTEAHKRGLEVYAWVNPYRYSPKGSTWGQSPLDYVHTHPEWLMTTSHETVLNPGIPEVRQRVVDVCRDIVTKYDVDGLVFDDYFYNQGGSSFDLDSVQYNAYKNAGGTMEQDDWRRENVNQMVKDVNDMVKSVKPWVRFGIGPAGVACSSPTVAAKYGVEPSPGSDWQYNQIYSDPMAWVTRGTIDFISPQVYWNTTGNYDEVTYWWGKIGKKFNRHVYISGYAVETATDAWSLDEYVTQVNVMRDAMLSGDYGMVYFKYSTWRNLSQKIDNKVTQLRHYLKQNVYTTPSLSPVVAFQKPDRAYTAVTNVRLDGDSLRWNPDNNVRYVVYAIPQSVSDAQFSCQPQYMLGVSYNPAYFIPAQYKTGYRYAVTILDRWENEYAPVMMGASPAQAPKPVITSPADGSEVLPLNELSWEASGATQFTVQVFSDAEMTQLVANVAIDSTSCSVAAIPGLSDGNYWWRVVARGVNLWDNASDARSFSLKSMAITSPANGATDVSLTPTMTWTRVDDESITYTLELSTTAAMTSVVYSQTTTQAQFTIPQFQLSGASTYYARVTARRGEATDATPVTSFRTLDVVPAVPVMLVPATDGSTLYSTSRISVKPEEGIGSLRIEISASTSFPARSSYRGVISDWSFASPELGSLTGVSKLTAGSTYYVRARYAYQTVATGTTAQYTAYTPILTFVYKEGITGDVNGDGEVDVNDVNILINIILGRDSADNYAGRANVNGVGDVDVSDVNVLINAVLGK